MNWTAYYRLGPVRITVSIPDLQSGDRGSIPLQAIKFRRSVMIIRGNDNKTRSFKLTRIKSDIFNVQCMTCNQVFQVADEISMNKELKAHSCNTDQVDPEILQIAKNFEQILIEQRKEFASESKM
jgi:hypothetical protein